MNNEDHLQQHLELCHRMYLRMLADGSWPWPDSQESENVVDSNDPDSDV